MSIPSAGVCSRGQAWLLIVGAKLCQTRSWGKGRRCCSGCQQVGAVSSSPVSGEAPALIFPEALPAHPALTAAQLPQQLKNSRERQGTRDSRASAELGRCPDGRWEAEKGIQFLFPSPFIFLSFINDLSYNSRDINRMLQFQMSPSSLPAPPLSLLSGALTTSFALIKTNNKLKHLIRVIQKLNTAAIVAPVTSARAKPALFSLP